MISENQESDRAPKRQRPNLYVNKNSVLEVGTFFSHNCHNYSMFRDVPGCSGMFRDVPSSWFYRRPHSWASCSRVSRNFHNSKEIHRRITPAASSNSIFKDNEKSQPQPQKKGRSSIIDLDDENRTLMHERGCFRSHFRTACLLVMLE